MHFTVEMDRNSFGWLPALLDAKRQLEEELEKSGMEYNQKLQETKAVRLASVRPRAQTPELRFALLALADDEDLPVINRQTNKAFTQSRSLGLALLVCLVFFSGTASKAQVLATQFKTALHPRVFATDSDRASLLEKIRDVPWAHELFTGMKTQVDQILAASEGDRGYLPSRLQMNWEVGKRYTDFYTKGNFIPIRKGDAPFPTVRVTFARAATGSTPLCSYDRLTPYGDGPLPELVNGKWVQIPFADTGLGTETLNQAILTEAYRASILYYLTGEKKYGQFAADIWWTFVRGASYQKQVNPDEDYDANGFLSWETLGDSRHFATVALTYDFLYKYLQNEYFTAPEFTTGLPAERWAPPQPGGRQWANERIHIMFEKFIDNKLQRGGGLIGNWNLNEQQSAELYALAMDDDDAYPDHRGREYYVSKLIYGPSSRSHGALIDVAAANIDPATGLWPEAPGGYGQGSLSQLVRFGFWYWKNGIGVLMHNPLIYKGALSFPEIAFPNGMSTNYGDSSYQPIHAEEAEEMVAYARATEDAKTEQTFTALLRLSGPRRFDSEYYEPLFFYVPELESTSLTLNYPRTSYSVPLSLIFERNLSDTPEDALAYTVHGFGKDIGHRQPNGMDMELYGRGEVVVFNPGQGHDYWSDDHVRYQSRSAGHNDVIPNGLAAEIDMPQNLEVMHADPALVPGKNPKVQVSPDFQFTDTFDDYKTSGGEADQRRVMGIVRLSKTSGYYVDIFRSRMKSAPDVQHDYIVHCLGSTLSLMAQDGKELPEKSVLFTKQSGPGYDYFSDVRQIPAAADTAAIFDTGYKDIHLKALYPGSPGRSIFAVHAPPMWRTNIADVRTEKTSAVILRQSGEAWQHPFIAIYEPFGNGVNSVVQSAKLATTEVSGDFVAIEVRHTDGTDLVLNATSVNALHRSGAAVFQGSYGVTSARDDGSVVLYLGSGKELSNGGIGLNFISGEHAASVVASGKGKSWAVRYSSEADFQLFLPKTTCSDAQKYLLHTSTSQHDIEGKFVRDGIQLDLPGALDAAITCENK
jgi:hypothetical protein